MTDFNRKTKQLLSTASHGRINIRNFEKRFPGISNQLRADAGADYLDWWGQSLNVDEFEQALIVDPKILSTIGRIAKYPIRDGQRYHAGLIHTYGYLLSVLPTRYGYKRERWTSGVIESGFGLPRGVLSPSPESGTLLKNASFVLMSLALSFEAKTQQAPMDLADFDDLPTKLRAYSFNRIAVTRIMESVRIARNRQPCTVELFTDIARFKRPTAAAESLLVYSYQLKNQSRGSKAEPRKLVTCFPVSKPMRISLVEEVETKNSTVRPRYNLVVDGLPKEGLTGKRTVQAQSAGS